ncbi:MAG: T9SS type A sorting domain-containing protein [Bacteroidales bacterium]|nr:T9SS type A sorting domain-containing protein [Bacteroidales bacterium]
MSKIYQFFSSLILAIFIFPITVSATPPNWVPAENLQFNMQIVAYFQLEDNSYSINPNDLIAGFVNGECRGLASPLVEADGRIFLSIGSNVSSGETVVFKAYLSETGQIANLSQTLPFIDQEAVGDYNNPFIFTIDLLYPPATYIINATAGNNGTIDPAGAVEVVHGNNQLFTFTADENYTVFDVIVDGESLGILDSFEFENVTEVHSIAVSFSLIQSLQTPLSNEIKVFPNPAKDAITVDIDLKGNQDYPYQISDLKGQVIREGKLTPASRQIQLHELKSGNYIFSIISPKEEFAPVVIQKVN